MEEIPFDEHIAISAGNIQLSEANWSRILVNNMPSGQTLENV